MEKKRQVGEGVVALSGLGLFYDRAVTRAEAAVDVTLPPNNENIESQDS